MSEINEAALERMKASLSRSKNLMKLDGKIDSFARMHRDGINESTNGAASAPKLTTEVKKKGLPTNAGASSKLPREIVESFRNNYIDPYASPIESEANGLTNALYESLSNDTDVITEQATPVVQQPVVQTVNAGIDYPTIRAIIEETVRKYTEPIQKKMLNESKGAGNELGLLTMGKTFKFVSKSGDIYEAKLVKVGNVNDK